MLDKIETTYLPNRKSVVDCTNRLLTKAKKQWIGMGRTAAWIKLPEFKKAVVDARTRNVNFKVIIFFEGDADKHCSSWIDIGAEVGFFEHGYIRLIIVDNSDAIIAFPKVVTSLYEDREYFGFHVSGEAQVSELLNYFNQIWEQSEKLGRKDFMDYKDSKLRIRKVSFAAGILRFIVRVISRAFPDWLS